MYIAAESILASASREKFGFVTTSPKLCANPDIKKDNKLSYSVKSK